MALRNGQWQKISEVRRQDYTKYHKEDIPDILQCCTVISKSLGEASIKTLLAYSSFAFFFNYFFLLCVIFWSPQHSLFSVSLSTLGEELDEPSGTGGGQGRKPRSCCRGSHHISESWVFLKASSVPWELLQFERQWSYVKKKPLEELKLNVRLLQLWSTIILLALIWKDVS